MLQARLDTKTLRGDVGRGITVYTDDPQRPKVFLVLRAIVLTSVGFLPDETLTLTNRHPDATSSQLLVRKDLTESGSLEITNVRTSVPWLRAEASKIDQARPGGDGRPSVQPGDWELSVEIGPNPTNYSAVEEFVIFETGLTREPTIMLPVALKLAPPVNLPFARLVVPDGEGAVDTADFVFSLRRGENPEQLEVVGSTPELTIAVERSGRRGFKARVSWDGAATEGSLQFRLGREDYDLPVVRGAVAD